MEKNRKDLNFKFLGSGGTLYKGKGLAPFVSMVIHGLLNAESLMFFLSEKVFVNCLENVLKREFNIFQTIHKHFFSDKNNISDRAIKSPWITMDTKGANTFPLYNVPPEPKI